jgi:glycosyltransferase involved in cell wall biosynthesis
MRLGFDGACLVNRRGFGRFARGILEGLAATAPGHSIEVFADAATATRLELPAGVTVRATESKRMAAEAASAKGARSLGDLWTMARAIGSANYDAVYFPSSMTYVPMIGVRNVIVTMHDTLAVDRPELVFPTRRGRLFWWAKEQAARWTSARLTTVSETSCRDLARYFRMPEDAIGLLTEGVDPVFAKPASALPAWAEVATQYGLPADRPFWLYVGGLSPHKNLLRLIEAFAGLPESVGHLVLVGDFADTFHTHVPELRAKVAELGCEGRVTFPGFVPDEALAVVYRNAHAVVLPSLWEGFGLPAAEAMASGTPVLHSTAGSLPEVVSEAGLAFDPLSVESMRSAWLRLAEDETLRNELAANGLRRSIRYRWEEAGRLLWNEVETLVARRRQTERRAG